MYILYLIILATSLSMDAFSVSLSIGNYIKNKFIFSLIICVFHFLFSISGHYLGFLLSNYVHNTDMIAFIIFLYIAVNMYQERKNKQPKININFLSIFLVTIGVSIDSFGVGITITQNILLSATIISLFAFSFTYIGLILNKYLQENDFSIIGIIILFIISIVHLHKFIFNFV